MKGAVFLVAVLVSGCATPSSTAPPAPPRKTVADLYLEAHERHMAPVDKWMQGISERTNCYSLAGTNPGAFRSCLDQAPPPESFLPKDRKKDETISEYMERKEDEWGERDCFYKGLMDARYIGESQCIEDQCKRDLEIKRLRKAVEKPNKQNQR